MLHLNVALNTKNKHVNRKERLITWSKNHGRESKPEYGTSLVSFRSLKVRINPMLNNPNSKANKEEKDQGSNP